MESKETIVDVESVSNDLISYISQYKSDSEFEGMYHHMGFQWWSYDIWSSGFQATMLTRLEYLDRSELYEFVSQYLRRMCDTKQPKGDAMRALLAAAFGTQDQFEIKEE
ncbi:hypothetical protein Q0V21_08280 [Paenibacillus sp. 11B]|uniref:hypothetical protein n=1 Tax=Paenibacillus sp. 11B TaxID=3060965 RepID=UPI0026570595|nr:hypothetical protein [Paenibacillus sp. 11B]MDN8588766.1 hypothetical protein [Paenibacillus sp. 11B]